MTMALTLPMVFGPIPILSGDHWRRKSPVNFFAILSSSSKIPSPIFIGIFEMLAPYARASLTDLFTFAKWFVSIKNG